MNVIFSDRIKEAGREMILRPATDYLQTVIAPRSAPKVTVEWDLKKDNGQVSYTLRLSDWAASAEETFTTDELRENGSDLRWRLSRLWGNVLQKRNHILLDHILADAPES